MLPDFLTKPRRQAVKSGVITLDCDGVSFDIKIRHNARAKRYTLRLSQADQRPVLTIPHGGSVREGADFAKCHTDWLKDRLTDRPQPIALLPGTIIPFKGVPHNLVATGKARGQVACFDDGETPSILIPGQPAHFERRLVDFLKKEARSALEASCAHHAGNLGLHYKSITIRDQRTRWGSCSSNARLNFSWRLILAPPDVLDYVAAHEVAHLEEMNHQPAFWALVKKTCPDMDVHRHWLRQNGGQLHLYGVEKMTNDQQ